MKMTGKRHSSKVASREASREVAASRTRDPLLEFRDQGFGRWMDEFFARQEPQAARFMPAVDVSEDDAKYCITVELPGASKDDVTVEHHENMLTIRGEKKSEREEKQERSRLVERSYGAFSRSFTLPRDADPDHVHAAFKNGVLEVEIPKTEEAKPRTVSIKS